MFTAIFEILINLVTPIKILDNFTEIFDIWTCAAPTGLPAADRFLSTFDLINLILRILGQNLKKRGTKRSAAA